MVVAMRLKKNGKGAVPIALILSLTLITPHMIAPKQKFVGIDPQKIEEALKRLARINNLKNRELMRVQSILTENQLSLEEKLRLAKAIGQTVGLLISRNGIRGIEFMRGVSPFSPEKKKGLMLIFLWSASNTTYLNYLDSIDNNIWVGVDREGVLRTVENHNPPNLNSFFYSFLRSFPQALYHEDTASLFYSSLEKIGESFILQGEGVASTRAVGGAVGGGSFSLAEWFYTPFSSSSFLVLSLTLPSAVLLNSTQLVEELNKTAEVVLSKIPTTLSKIEAEFDFRKHECKSLSCNISWVELFEWIRRGMFLSSLIGEAVNLLYFSGFENKSLSLLKSYSSLLLKKITTSTTKWILNMTFHSNYYCFPSGEGSAFMLRFFFPVPEFPIINTVNLYVASGGSSDIFFSSGVHGFPMVFALLSLSFLLSLSSPLLIDELDRISINGRNPLSEFLSRINREFQLVSNEPKVSTAKLSLSLNTEKLKEALYLYFSAEKGGLRDTKIKTEEGVFPLRLFMKIEGSHSKSMVEAVDWLNIYFVRPLGSLTLKWDGGWKLMATKNLKIAKLYERHSPKGFEEVSVEYLSPSEVNMDLDDFEVLYFGLVPSGNYPQFVYPNSTSRMFGLKLPRVPWRFITYEPYLKIGKMVEGVLVYYPFAHPMLAIEQVIDAVWRIFTNPLYTIWGNATYRFVPGSRGSYAVLWKSLHNGDNKWWDDASAYWSSYYSSPGSAMGFPLPSGVSSFHYEGGKVTVPMLFLLLPQYPYIGGEGWTADEGRLYIYNLPVGLVIMSRLMPEEDTPGAELRTDHGNKTWMRVMLAEALWQATNFTWNASYVSITGFESNPEKEFWGTFYPAVYSTVDYGYLTIYPRATVYTQSPDSITGFLVEAGFNNAGESLFRELVVASEEKIFSYLSATFPYPHSFYPPNKYKFSSGVFAVVSLPRFMLGGNGALVFGGTSREEGTVSYSYNVDLVGALNLEFLFEGTIQTKASISGVFTLFVPSQSYALNDQVLIYPDTTALLGSNIILGAGGSGDKLYVSVSAPVKYWLSYHTSVIFPAGMTLLLNPVPGLAGSLPYITQNSKNVQALKFNYPCQNQDWGIATSSLIWDTLLINYLDKVGENHVEYACSGNPYYMSLVGDIFIEYGYFVERNRTYLSAQLKRFEFEYSPFYLDWQDMESGEYPAHTALSMKAQWLPNRVLEGEDPVFKPLDTRGLKSWGFTLTLSPQDTKSIEMELEEGYLSLSASGLKMLMLSSSAPLHLLYVDPSSIEVREAESGGGFEVSMNYTLSLFDWGGYFSGWEARNITVGRLTKEGFLDRLEEDEEYRSLFWDAVNMTVEGNISGVLEDLRLLVDEGEGKIIVDNKTLTIQGETKIAEIPEYDEDLSSQSFLGFLLIAYTVVPAGETSYSLQDSVVARKTTDGSSAYSSSAGEVKFEVTGENKSFIVFSVEPLFIFPSWLRKTFTTQGAAGFLLTLIFWGFIMFFLMIAVILIVPFAVFFGNRKLLEHLAKAVVKLIRTALSMI